jgi:hypothetical protein
MSSASPVRVTRDLRVISPPDAPPLTGSQAVELGKTLLERGCIAVALETIDRAGERRRGHGMDEDE